MAGYKSDLVDIEVRVITETSKSYLFDFGGKEPVWVAKASCQYNALEDIVTMREALAIEKGMV